jgi:methionine synthase I (cobalamin-dependent)
MAAWLDEMLSSGPILTDGAWGTEVNRAGVEISKRAAGSEARVFASGKNKDRTAMGTTATQAAETLSALGVDVIGGPERKIGEIGARC